MFHKGRHTQAHTHARTRTHTHTHTRAHTRTHTPPLQFLLRGKAALCHMCKSQQKQILYVPVSCSPGCVVMVTELVHQGTQPLSLSLALALFPPAPSLSPSSCSLSLSLFLSLHRWVIQPISWVVSSPRWSF